MEKSYRVLHALNLPQFSVAPPDAENAGEVTVGELRKNPGDVVTLDELRAARQTDEDILRLTTEHLPADASSEGIAMCSEADYGKHLEAAAEITAQDAQIQVLRAMGISDDKISTLLDIELEPVEVEPKDIEFVEEVPA
jgi:translation initiation factor 2 alpha subunit (eIF-2alpha)